MPRSRIARMALTVSALIILASLLSILHSDKNNNARIETSDVPLQASFTYAVDGGSVSFTDQSRGLNLKSWLWDFGDGATSAERSPLHTFSNIGNYTVRLTVIDSSGRTSEHTEVVWVSSTSAAPLQSFLIILLILMVVAFVGALFIPYPAGRIAMVALFLGSLLMLVASGVLAASSLAGVIL
jgi:hypothetical protein